MTASSFPANLDVLIVLRRKLVIFSWTALSWAVSSTLLNFQDHIWWVFNKWQSWQFLVFAQTYMSCSCTSYECSFLDVFKVSCFPLSAIAIDAKQILTTWLLAWSTCTTYLTWCKSFSWVFRDLSMQRNERGLNCLFSILCASFHKSPNRFSIWHGSGFSDEAHHADYHNLDFLDNSHLQLEICGPCIIQVVSKSTIWQKVQSSENWKQVYWEV